MKRDIELIEVTNVHIVIIPETLADGEKEWGAYVLNLKPVELNNVLVNVSAKGVIKGVEKETASLRFFLDTIPPNSAKKLEVILPEAFALENKYWVSFYEGGIIQDKKFIAEANTIDESKLELTPVIHKPGILLR